MDSSPSVASLRRRLRRTYRRDALFQAVAALCWGGAAVAAIVLAGVALEAWLWMPTALRTALLTGTAVLFGGYVGARVAPPLLQWIGAWPLPPDETLARTVGASTPAIADRLVTLFQLDDGRSSAAPTAVRQAAVTQLADAIAPRSFDALVQPDRVRRAAPWLLVPALVATLSWAVLPNASARLLAPATSFERPAPYALSVEPGNATRVQGDALTIEAGLVDRISPDMPDAVVVEMETPSGTRTQRMTARSDGPRWTLDLPNVRDGFTYRVRAGDVASPSYAVDVATRPLVRRLNVTVAPPSYTRDDAESLPPNTGDVTALQGSRVTVEATLGGGPMTDAVLRFADGRERPMDIENGVATGRFTVTDATAYHIHLRNAEGVANPNPVRYAVDAQADQPPRITFEAPAPTASLEADRVADLVLRLRDDFGFARLRLHYRLDRGDTDASDTASYDTIDLPLERPLRTEQQIAHTWLLVQDSGLDVLPGDEVVYYAEVWDNDAVSGFKTARTATQRLRVPTAADRYAELDETQERSASSLQAVREQSSALQEQFRQLRDEVRRTQSASWEQQAQAQQMRQQQQSMSRQVEEAARQLESATRQMEQQNLNREETREMYRELQDVIREIEDPAFQEALRALQESMESMDFRQMQQSMEQVEENMQAYRERLERATELFERLRAQQQIDALRDQAEQLRDEQDAIQADTETAEQATQDEGTSSEDADAPDASSANDTASSDAEPAPDAEESSSSAEDAEALSRRQERARERMEALEEALREASEELADTPGVSPDDLQSMQSQASQSGIQQQMQEAAQSLQQQDFQSAQSAQQQASQGLSEMSSSLGQMSQGMSQSQQSLNTQGIWYAIENTLWLSDAQERLRDRAARLSNDGAQLRTLAQEQQRLRTGLEAVGDSLAAVARSTPQLSRVVRQRLGAGLNAMQTAVSQLDTRNGRRARPAQTESMAHLNELAKLLSDVLDQMQSGGGQGSGGMSMGEMMQQMQQMTGNQQALNRALQEHLQNVAGERLSVDEAARRQQLRARQQRLQEQMQTLSQEDVAQQMTGDLDRIADEMEQALQDMQNPRNERDVLDRQQRIVTQMLQAQRALQSQGQSEQRQGQEATDVERRRSPSELPPEEAAEVLRQGLLDAIEGNYSDEYERLIRRYFEALEAQEDDTP